MSNSQQGSRRGSQQGSRRNSPQDTRTTAPQGTSPRSRPVDATMELARRIYAEQEAARRSQSPQASSSQTARQRTPIDPRTELARQIADRRASLSPQDQRRNTPPQAQHTRTSPGIQPPSPNTLQQGLLQHFTILTAEDRQLPGETLTQAIQRISKDYNENASFRNLSEQAPNPSPQELAAMNWPTNPFHNQATRAWLRTPHPNRYGLSNPPPGTNIQIVAAHLLHPPHVHILRVWRNISSQDLLQLLSNLAYNHHMYFQQTNNTNFRPVLFTGNTFIPQNWRSLSGFNPGDHLPCKHCLWLLYEEISSRKVDQDPTALISGITRSLNPNNIWMERIFCNRNIPCNNTDCQSNQSLCGQGTLTPGFEAGIRLFMLILYILRVLSSRGDDFEDLENVDTSHFPQIHSGPDSFDLGELISQLIQHGAKQFKEFFDNTRRT